MFKIFKSALTFAMILYSIAGAQNKSTLKLNLLDKQYPFGLTAKIVEEEPKIALVLSGGGSRGLSQIGVLRALHENNIPIEYIVGTSMGSIVGGLYSAGYSIDELDSIAVTAKWNEFFAFKETDRRDLFYEQKLANDKALFAIRINGFKPILPTSVTTGQKVSNFLTLLALDAPIHSHYNFDELLYKFRAVSTDLVSGKSIVLDKGSLSKAMRASSSVTLLLSPVKVDSLLLVDGGLVANIPADIAKILGSDLVIASNTTSPLYDEKELQYPWNVADQILSIPMKRLNEIQLNSADIIIESELKHVTNNDFSAVDTLISKGYKSTLPLIKSIKEKFKKEFYKNISGSEIYYKKLVLGKNSTPEEISFLKSFAGKDSVSNKDLLFQLYLKYKTGDYKDVSADITEDSSNTLLHLNLHLNPSIKNYTVEGINVIDKNIVISALDPLLNKPFNYRQIVNSILKILRSYRRLGYSLADLENINFNETEQTLHLKFSEGKISKILIEGNEKTNRSVITREVLFKDGDYFNFDKARKTLINIKSTDLFESVDMEVMQDSDKNILKISVKEKYTSILRFGLRIDNENFTQILLDIRDENLFGSGTEFGATIAGGSRTRSFTLEHRANRIFDTYLTYKIKGYYTFDDVNVYKDDSTGSKNKFRRSKTGEYRQIYAGGSIGIGAQFEKFGNIIFEGKYESNEVKNKYDFPARDTYKINIASVKLSLSIDSQNKYPYPTDGFIIHGFYETAQSILNTDQGFTKFSLDYIGHITFNKYHTISPRFAIGFGDKTLPLSKQFSLGGQQSFFGLRDDEYRGRQVFLASLEYQLNLPFKLFFETYFKIRYDIGSIWAEKEQIRLKDLRHGLGATLSLDTPIGPADFSVGRSFLIKGSSPDKFLVKGPVFFYFTIGYYY